LTSRPVTSCYLLFFPHYFFAPVIAGSKSDYRIIFQQLDGTAPVIEKQDGTGAITGAVLIETGAYARCFAAMRKSGTRAPDRHLVRPSHCTSHSLIESPMGGSAHIESRMTFD
jgi:hypothetical protein